MGWLGSIISGKDSREMVMANMAAGTAGAALAVMIANPLIGGGNIAQAQYSAGVMAASFLGAIALVAIVNFVRRGSTR